MAGTTKYTKNVLSSWFALPVARSVALILSQNPQLSPELCASQSVNHRVCTSRSPPSLHQHQHTASGVSTQRESFLHRALSSKCNSSPAILPASQPASLMRIPSARSMTLYNKIHFRIPYRLVAVRLSPFSCFCLSSASLNLSIPAATQLLLLVGNRHLLSTPPTTAVLSFLLQPIDPARCSHLARTPIHRSCSVTPSYQLHTARETNPPPSDYKQDTSLCP